MIGPPSMVEPMPRVLSFLPIVLLLAAGPADAQFFGFPPTPGSQPQYQQQPNPQPCPQPRPNPRLTITICNGSRKSSARCISCVVSAAPMKATNGASRRRP